MPYLPKPTRKAYPPQRRRSNNSPERKKFYDSTQWQAVRQLQLRAVPYCEVCHKDVVVGGHIDHIVPISRGGAMVDERNLQTLCPVHHDKKSRLERHYGCMVEPEGEKGALIPKAGEKQRLLTKLME